MSYPRLRSFFWHSITPVQRSDLSLQLVIHHSETIKIDDMIGKGFKNHVSTSDRDLHEGDPKFEE